jgi:hypothetical protein
MKTTWERCTSAFQPEFHRDFKQVLWCITSPSYILDTNPFLTELIKNTNATLHTVKYYCHESHKF